MLGIRDLQNTTATSQATWSQLISFWRNTALSLCLSKVQMYFPRTVIQSFLLRKLLVCRTWLQTEVSKGDVKGKPFAKWLSRYRMRLVCENRDNGKGKDDHERKPVWSRSDFV